jgi:ankyrin repeat protein
MLRSSKPRRPGLEIPMLDRRICLLVAAALWTGVATAQTTPHPNVNARLLVASRQGDAALVLQLLQAGADVDARNRFGKTPLHTAAEKGQTELVAALLKAGANARTASVNDRVTALMAASYAGHADIVTALLAAGADAAALDRMNKPAILYAAGQGQTAALQRLLDHGVAVNTAYAHGLTALMWAAGQGHVEATRLLLARGADMSLKDDRGLTAADMARQGGHSAALALFAHA